MAQCQELAKARKAEPGWNIFGEYLSKMAELAKEDWLVIKSQPTILSDLISDFQGKVKAARDEPIVRYLANELASLNKALPLYRAMAGDSF